MKRASAKRPVKYSIPRIAINVSRPQQRMKPVEKCGKPAAIVAQNSGGLGDFKFGLNAGKLDVLQTLTNCNVANAKDLVKLLPLLINLKVFKILNVHLE